MTLEGFHDAIATGEIVAPDYGGSCIANVVPALLEHPAIGEGFLPPSTLDADQVVLFVVDGLGWHQLRSRESIAPTLAHAEGGPVTSVSPSTTAAALASITTGVPPGEHGLVGYRMKIAGEVLNVLRWSTDSGDARARIPPAEVQSMQPFGGRAPVIVNKAEFAGSGFTLAHLDGVRFTGYGTPATLVHETAQAIRTGERFVYAYYDGLDRTGHERGHDQGFDAEFGFVDRMVADLRGQLPDSCALVVTADHGQIDCGPAVIDYAPDVTSRLIADSGEARFVWLHARPGHSDALFANALKHHGREAFVLTADQVIDAGLLGPVVSSQARSILGDVALIARGSHAFGHPATKRAPLLGRHGGLTPEEMLVPLLSV